MRIARDAFLLLTAAIAACNRDALTGPRLSPSTTPHAGPTAPPSPSAASASSAPPVAATRSAAAPPSQVGAHPAPPPSPWCRRLAAARTAEARRIAGTCDASTATPVTSVEMRTAEVRGLLVDRFIKAESGFDLNSVCKSTPVGSWGVALRDFSFMSPVAEGGPACGWQARGALVFEAPGGAKAELARQSYYDVLGYARASRILAVFDYDGDGAPEAVVQDDGESFFASCSQTPGDTRVFTARPSGRGGPSAIAEYPVRRAFDGVEDFDGDGRPDLVDSSYFLVTRPDGGLCGTVDVHGPSVLLHSLRDGTFSIDDEISRAFARKQCPAPPALTRVVEIAACARLWGIGKAELLAAADVELRATNPVAAAAELAAIEKIANTPLPFAPLSDPAPPRR
jgi:hypothetical protein